MFNYICPDGQRASGGTSIMVKSSVPHSQFDLNTNLQAVAVNATLSKKVTICSIMASQVHNNSGNQCLQS